MKKLYYSRPFLTKDECAYLMDYYETQNPERIANDYMTADGRILDRKQNVISMTTSEKPHAFFEKKLRAAHKDICDNMGYSPKYLYNFQRNWMNGRYPHLPYTTPEFEQFDPYRMKTFEAFLSRYDVGNYCAPHIDNIQIGRMLSEWYWDANNVPQAHRLIHPRLYIVSVILNDEFEGGELKIAENEEALERGELIDASPPPGCLVAMEAGCIHEVTPVTAGSRYSFISWAYMEHESFYPEGSLKDIFDYPTHPVN